MLPQVLSFGDTGFGDELLAGAAITVQLALAALVFGILLGLALAAAKLSQSLVLRGLAEGYALIIRGIPEFLVVLVIFFGSGQALRAVLGALGYDGYVEVSAFAAGTIALGLVFGAFSSEVFRGAFLAVPRGQMEAAVACGMTRWQAFRRIRLPQMWRFAIPGLGNLWMVLLKDTSLVSVIALDELLRWSNVAAETTREPFTFYVAAAVIYLLLTIASDGARARLEAYAARGVPRH
jgi:His/Glu/Gln/Arg/opine family amino acid ABC transporter permease subunit